MRIVAVSDTHQNTALFRRCVLQAIEDGPVDVFIHCGDGVRDLSCVEENLRSSNPDVRIYAVRGNCDIGDFRFPVSELADLNGVRAFITHGNLYQVKHGLGKLAKAARAFKAGLAFFGHTHQAVVAEKHGVVLINPGSLASWNMTDTAYLEVTVDKDQRIYEKFIKQRLPKD
jgi:putative phosphoesterase